MPEYAILIFGGADLDEKAYRVVKSSDINEMNRKIHRHRRRILLLTALVVILLLGTLMGSYIYIQTRSYKDYEVLNSVERKDSGRTLFAAFNENMIKYSKDGASCIDTDNHMIWNQTYEMQSPMVDTCEGYAVIADSKGEKVYIMDTDGPCGEIRTTMPIQRVQGNFLQKENFILRIQDILWISVSLMTEESWRYLCWMSMMGMLRLPLSFIISVLQDKMKLTI